MSHEITLVQFARDVETVRAPTTEVRG
jgi:hypothetical protein